MRPNRQISRSDRGYWSWPSGWWARAMVSRAMIFRDLTIRQKLALLTLTSSVFAVISACVGFAIYERQRFHTAIADELATLADTLGANTAASLAFNDAKTAREMLAALRTEPPVLRACLYGLHWPIFAEYRRADLGPKFAMPSPEPDGTYFG